MDVSTRIRRVTLGTGYTFLDATFQSPEQVNGSGNSSNQDALNGMKGLDQPDGVFYLGPGATPAYAVVSLSARYQWTPRVQFFVRVNNLFDQHYYTAAQLGATGLTNAGTFIARPFPATASGDFPVRQSAFFAPGAPIGIWGGVRISF